MAHEEVLEAGAGAVFAEVLLLAEDLGGGDDDGEGLILADEGGNTDGHVGLGGEASADAQCVADFNFLVVGGGCGGVRCWQFSVVSGLGAGDGGEADVVDLGVGAPEGAAGDGDLELAREVVEVGVGGEDVGDFYGEGGAVDELVGIEAGEGAAGDVADDVSAGALGGEADLGELVDDVDEGLEGEPVELDVLAGGDVGEVAGVLLGDLADDAELVRGEEAVGQADAHHEELGGLALAADAAGGADAVALGVDAPPFEVEAGPLGEDGAAAVAGELADLVPGVPGVLGELEALGFLGLGFLHWGRGGGCEHVWHGGVVDSLFQGQKKKPTRFVGAGGFAGRLSGGKDKGAGGRDNRGCGGSRGCGGRA